METVRSGHSRLPRDATAVLSAFLALFAACDRSAPVPAEPPAAPPAAPVAAAAAAPGGPRPLVIAGPEGLAVVGRDGRIGRRITDRPLELALWLPDDGALVALAADGRSVLEVDLATGAVRPVAALPETIAVCASIEHVAGEMAIGDDGPEDLGSIRVQSDEDVWLDADGEALCLTMLDRNVNMMDYEVHFRVELASGAVRQAIGFPEECAAEIPRGCRWEDRPEPPAPPPARESAWPFDIDAEGRIARDGEVVGAFPADLEVRESYGGPRSPSGRWVVVGGGIDGGDYIWRSLWLLDRSTGDVFPTGAGPWPSPIDPADADADETGLAVGETTVRWMGGEPELLVVDQCLVTPGTGTVCPGGRFAW